MEAMNRIEIVNEVHANIDFFRKKWDAFCRWVETCAEQLGGYQRRETRECETISQERRDVHKAWRSAKTRNDRAGRQKWVAVLREINRKHKAEVRKKDRRFEWLQAHGWAKWEVYPYPLSSHDDFHTFELMLDSNWPFYAPCNVVNPVLWAYGRSNPPEPDPDYRKERLLVDCALLVVTHDATVRPVERICQQGTYRGTYFDCDGFCKALAENLDKMDENGDLQRAWHDVRIYALAHRQANQERQLPLVMDAVVPQKTGERSDRQEQTGEIPYVEIDLAERTLTIGETKITPTDKVWKFLKELADTRRHKQSGLDRREWKNAADMLRHKIGRENLRLVVESTAQGYKLAQDVKLKGGGQMGIRRTK